MALSTTKVEYMATMDATCEVVWLQRICEYELEAYFSLYPPL